MRFSKDETGKRANEYLGNLPYFTLGDLRLAGDKNGKPLFYAIQLLRKDDGEARSFIIDFKDMARLHESIEKCFEMFPQLKPEE